MLPGFFDDTIIVSDLIVIASIPPLFSHLASVYFFFFNFSNFFEILCEAHRKIGSFSMQSTLFVTELL